MKRVLCIIVIALSMISFVGCNNQTYDGENTKNDYIKETEKKGLSYYEAIEHAKKAAENQNPFLGYYHHSIVWADCTAELTESNQWKVHLTGKISGYSDKYQTDLRNSGRFSADAEFSYGGGYVLFWNGKVS